MKAIMVMFDSLNRRMLPPYGCDWTHAPNFARLAQRCVTFDTSYVCSMPCMPARRDLHTGRPSFLHRAWGPLEPFDDSMPQMLSQSGVSSHLLSDHYHYWEDGGATYHTRYDTWQSFRGQEGDPYVGQVNEPAIPPNLNGKGRRQDWVNRAYLRTEAQQPQSQTFAAGLEFLERNHDADNWFLQIETFDPHEPFVSPDSYKRLYPHDYDGPHFNWPNYGPVRETPEQVQHMRLEYAALLSMCDANLGKILDAMDQHGLWEDTMLIVWTDHGFMLGEHGCWAKNWMPLYEEIARTPFFIHDPRHAVAGQRRAALVQPSIDLAPTLLDFFGLPPAPHMLGHSLAQTIADDTPVRDVAIFGYHGSTVNITDGCYVYMREPLQGNQPLYNYTLLPTRMRGFFALGELRASELAPPFTFTKSCPVLKIPVTPGPHVAKPSLLFDLQSDPRQLSPLTDTILEQQLTAQMITAMQACDAPPEQFQRLGLNA